MERPRGRLALAAATAALAHLAAAAPAAAATTHVDCDAASAGADGSRQHPLTTLADASARPLGPGAKLLLRRGSACAGTLALTGSGSKARPALVGAYGRGPRPLIGASGEDGVRLENVSHVVVEGLEVINPGDGTVKKRGVRLLAAGETVAGVTVRDLHVHDVGGNLDKDFGGSGGIQVDSAGPGVGRFRHLVIEDNRIEDVSRSGIFVVGVAGGERPRASAPWPEASSGVRIRRNEIRRIAGDGIVALGTDGARVRRNLVRRGNRAGRGLADPAGMICNAGIWAFHANNTVIEHNEVAGMRFNGCDGSGFDIDYDQDGTVVQFNYSHDNEGGFMLLCTDTEPRTAAVRFNLSVNDGFSFNSSPCSRPTGSYEGLRIHNNTIVGPDPGVAILGNPSETLFGPSGLDFFNNALVATEAGRAFACGPGCRRNLFFRMPAAGAGPIAAPPRFRGRRPYDADT
ncbi:MAG: hypothetical protein EDQ89_11770, partial [Acidobacteria bacterium]